MILTWIKISTEHLSGKIKISPFSLHHVNTNSYDLTLGNKFIRYTDAILDPKLRPKYEEIEIKNGDYIEMKKGDFLLASSKELIWSNFYVPIIHAKSWTARMWLFVHVTADLIDIGSYGATTFQLYATLPCKVYPWMKIAQVSFWETLWEIKLYEWKYQWSIWPRASEVWKDF